MKRDWREIWIYAKLSVKYSGIAIALVPLFFVVMNTEWGAPGYFSAMLVSLRIGSEIAFIIAFGLTLLHAGLVCVHPASYRKALDSMPFKIGSGLTMMAIALNIVPLVEAKMGGVSFKIQEMSIGGLIGSITFLLFIFFSAYRRSIVQNLKLRAESAESKLNVLHNQMQPHFLFNSLNSLAELIETRPEEASRLSQCLSDLYREILANSKTSLATAKSEVEIVRKYLTLEKVRFGERLRFDLQLPPDLESAKLPSLVLQTLVENSIKHSLSRALHGGQIVVRLSGKPTDAKVEVMNTSLEEEASLDWEQKNGTGLANTRERLFLLYGSKHRFSIDRSAGWTRVSFCVGEVADGA